MGKFTDKVLEDLTEIKVLQAKHTEVLEQHHQRSTQLEERFIPIEHHVIFIRGLSKFLLKALTALATILGIIALLMK